MGAEASGNHLSHHSSNSPLGIMIVAGEASGDKHAAALARSLVHLFPEIRFEMFGSGGVEMRAAGVDTLVDARDVAIIGVPEILRGLGKLYRAYRTLLDAARKRRPKVIVLVDWPDFNMRLARRFHREGFKVVYYISPQVWAWRRYRVKALRRDVDRMLVILPFEEAFYKELGVDVEYVGHPLVDAVRMTSTREEFCGRHSLDPARPIIALLPGSRKKEVHYHLPALVEASEKLSKLDGAHVKSDLWGIGQSRRNDIVGTGLKTEPATAKVQSGAQSPQFVIPLASTVDRSQVDRILSESGPLPKPDVRLVEGDTYNTLFHSYFAVVASGTATVEAALAGVPMVIIYRGSELNWRLIRPLIHLETFGMVNLIAGHRVAPELMQHNVTGDLIAREVAALVADPLRMNQMKRELGEVRERLKAGGGSGPQRAARAVMQIVTRDEA